LATPAAALGALERAARFAEARVSAEVAARALAHPGLPLAVRRELGGGVGLVPACAGADSLGGSR
jgi:hypothetical protein